MSRFSLILLVVGGLLLASGAGMRAYARLEMASTEQRLLAARPDAPLPAFSPAPSVFPPADGDPALIRLPASGLWNALEPVRLQPDGSWQTSDAGWHIASGRPGRGSNVVIAGHSPSSDPELWARSVFRQLAYLAPGETIELRAGRRIYRYAVAHVFALPADEAATPDAAAWIAPGGGERLTLVTCWPPHTAAYRVIVVAQPESYEE